MSKQLGQVLLNSMLGVAGIVVALLILEVGARSLASPYDSPRYDALICSDQLGWRGNPEYRATFTTDGYTHTVKHNSAGMHDNEHQLVKPENSFRILMLGDSFVRAAHVNEAETSHQVLEDLLNAHYEPEHFEVISAGITGWGTGQELLYYRYEGRRYKPDLVLLMVYVGNDVQNNLPGNALTIAGQNCYAPYFVLCDNRLDPNPWIYSPGLKPELGRCPFGRKTAANILGALYSASRLYRQIEPLLAADQPRFDKLPYYPLYLPEKHDLFDYAWQLSMALIKQLHQEVTADGVEFGVVLIGPADVINLSLRTPGEREALFQEIPDLRQAQADRPHSKLLAALAPEKIKILDLQPLFIEHIQQTGDALYFAKDSHWNVAGNRFAAESIFDWLDKQNDLPPGPGRQDVTAK